MSFELKYHRGEKVEFEVGPIVSYSGDVIKDGPQLLTGVIEIIDKYGTFEQHDEPSYDIYRKEDNALYKHCRQSSIKRSLGEAGSEERMR